MSGVIRLSLRATREINRHARAAMPHETGGILVGHYDGTDVIVERVVLVPPLRHEPANYTRNSSRAQTALTSLLHEDSSGALGYVGEWHSHPQPVGPSSTDRRSLASITRRNAEITALVVHAPGDSFWGLIGTPKRLRPRVEEAEVRSLLNNIRQRLGPRPAGAIDRDGPVFISYRHSDGFERADSLETLLHAAGIVVWRDIRDVRPGTIEDRLEIALSGGLSGAVLIVTPDVQSSPVIREREAPRLVELDEHPEFSLSIANDIPSQRIHGEPNYSAADQILGFAPDTVLADKKQVFSRMLRERLVIVNDLVRHRLEVRRTDAGASTTLLDIEVQTRPPTSSHDRFRGADLNIRVNAEGASGKELSLASRLALKSTLPIVSDAAYSISSGGISIRGGAHLSAAIALGATFPATRFGLVQVTDQYGSIWRSDDQLPRVDVAADGGENPTQAGPIAVGVFMTASPNLDVFSQLVEGLDVADSWVFRAMSSQFMEAGAGAATARFIADTVKELARKHRTLDVHLAFQGPFGLAIQIGQLLNTLRTHVYELEDSGDEANYELMFTLQLGHASSPIVSVPGEPR